MHYRYMIFLAAMMLLNPANANGAATILRGIRSFGSSSPRLSELLLVLVDGKHRYEPWRELGYGIWMWMESCRVGLGSDASCGLFGMDGFAGDERAEVKAVISLYRGGWRDGGAKQGRK